MRKNRASPTRDDHVHAISHSRWDAPVAELPGRTAIPGWVVAAAVIVVLVAVGLLLAAGLRP